MDNGTGVGPGGGCDYRHTTAVGGPRRRQGGYVGSDPARAAEARAAIEREQERRELEPRG